MSESGAEDVQGDATSAAGIDSVFLQRVRWRCRRGLLELDIVLGRFIDRHYSTLDEQQRLAFDELLDLPDTEFWDLITGAKEPIHLRQRGVLASIQEV